MLRALIFDFDGLIVDTESSSLSTVREAYRRHGQDLASEQWRQCVGSTVDPYDHLQRLVGPDVDLTTLREEMDARHRAEVAQLGARPGVVELVAAAVTAGLRLAVASSSSRRWVEGHLERIGALQAFHAIRCRDDVRQTKPAPDVYLAGLDGLGVKASEAVAFEDSPNGVQAARRAGIHTVAVPNGVTRGWPFDHADRVIGSLHGITVHVVGRWLATASNFGQPAMESSGGARGRLS